MHRLGVAWTFAATMGVAHRGLLILHTHVYIYLYSPTFSAVQIKESTLRYILHENRLAQISCDFTVDKGCLSLWYTIVTRRTSQKKMTAPNKPVLNHTPLCCWHCRFGTTRVTRRTSQTKMTAANKPVLNHAHLCCWHKKTDCIETAMIYRIADNKTILKPQHVGRSRSRILFFYLFHITNVQAHLWCGHNQARPRTTRRPCNINEGMMF